MSAVLLSGMTAGFQDACHGAQQTFRSLLEAMARPGRLFVLPPTAIDGLEPPLGTGPGEPLDLGATAVLLSLLDAETQVRLVGSLNSAAAQAYLRFHTGVRLAAPGGPADFTAAQAGELSATVWDTLALGSDEVPQGGATLVVQVPTLGEPGATRLVLRGPGIESTQRLGVSGLSPAFWQWRRGLQAALPRGVDLILTCGARLAALPRTTHIELEA
ncbi:MAG: phosphonate C-P lyase system protein PhnH [Pseudomonadota bacterium]